MLELVSHVVREALTGCLSFSLTKDMTGKEDVYRGPAIRALCRITDVSTHTPCPGAAVTEGCV